MAFEMSQIPPRSVSRQPITLAALLVILVVGCWLRIQRSSEIAYWFDEGFCVKMAEFSIPEIWTRVGWDTRPPLYFLMLKTWGAAFGTSPVTLRMLSCVCGLLCIVGTYLFVCEAYARRPLHATDRNPRGAALLAAAMVALSPLHVEWSLQVNVYSLGTALTAFSSWLLLRALRRNNRVRDWAQFTGTAALLLYTHPYGIFTVTAQVLFAAGYVFCIRRRDGAHSAKWTPMLVSAFGIQFLWQFWLPSFLAQRARVSGEFWSSSLTIDQVGRIFYQLVTNYRSPAAPPDIGLWLAQGLFIGLLLLLLGRRAADAYLALGVIVPLTVALVYSALVRNVVIPQYLLFAHLLLLVATAVLVWRLPRWWLRLPVAGVILVGIGVQSGRHYEVREQFAAHPGLPAVLERWQELQNHGEPLIVSNPMIYIPATPYVANRERIFAYGSNSQYPFYHGTTVMNEDEYLSRTDIENSDYRWIWTLDVQRWFNGDWQVRLPPDWRLVSESQYQEWYCELVLRLYQRDPDVPPLIDGKTTGVALRTPSEVQP